MTRNICRLGATWLTVVLPSDLLRWRYEDLQIGIVGAELLVEVGPGYDFGAGDARGPDGAPREPSVEVDLQGCTKLLNHVEVDRNRPAD